MLRKIFLGKVNEAIIKTDEAEIALNIAVKKIEEIISRSNFSLLREELIYNVRESNYISNKIGRHYGLTDSLVDEQFKIRLDEALNNIQECLDEMENIKDKSIGGI